jgi:hypothetical protein
MQGINPTGDFAGPVTSNEIKPKNVAHLARGTILWWRGSTGPYSTRIKPQPTIGRTLLARSALCKWRDAVMVSPAGTGRRCWAHSPSIRNIARAPPPISVQKVPPVLIGELMGGRPHRSIEAPLSRSITMVAGTPDRLQC